MVNKCTYYGLHYIAFLSVSHVVMKCVLRLPKAVHARGGMIIGFGRQTVGPPFIGHSFTATALNKMPGK